MCPPRDNPDDSAASPADTGETDAKPDDTLGDEVDLPPWTSPRARLRESSTHWWRNHPIHETPSRWALKHAVVLSLVVGLMLAPYWFIPSATVPGSAQKAPVGTVDQPPCVELTPRNHKRASNITATVEKVSGRDALHVTYNLSRADVDRLDLSFIRSSINVTTTSGFASEGELFYESTGDPTPSLVYTYPTNNTIAPTALKPPFAAGDGWTYGPLPTVNRYRVNYTPAPGGTVYIGAFETYRVYVGNLTKTTTSLGCQTLNVHVPSESELNGTYLAQTLRQAAARYPAGERISEVDIILTPWDMGYPAGFAKANVAFVRTSAFHLPSTIIHEYLHTRQVIDYGAGLEWMQEAVPKYYEYRLQYEVGLISSAKYAAFLTQNANSAEWGGPFESGWSQNHYHRGSVTLAALDHRIRNSTNGRHTLTDVIERLEARPHGLPVTREDLTTAIANVTNQSMNGTWVQQHIVEGNPVDVPTPDERQLSETQWRFLAQWNTLLTERIALALYFTVMLHFIVLGVLQKIVGVGKAVSARLTS